MELLFPESLVDSFREFLSSIGEDANREGLIDTPHRVMKAIAEMTEGYTQDPAKILERMFTESIDEMIVVKGIEFTSLCEHHLFPFRGVAHVGYIPKGRVIGLSKIPRLVHCFAKRLQVQERLTTQIATAMMSSALEPEGVAVVIKAHHSCMSCRGVKQANAEMVTSSMLGAFRTEPETRSEFLELIR